MYCAIAARLLCSSGSTHAPPGARLCITTGRSSARSGPREESVMNGGHHTAHRPMPRSNDAPCRPAPPRGMDSDTATPSRATTSALCRQKCVRRHQATRDSRGDARVGQNRLADSVHSWQADSTSRRAVRVVQSQKPRMGRGFTRMKRIDADEIALGFRVYPLNPRKSASYSSLRSPRHRRHVEKSTTPEAAKKTIGRHGRHGRLGRLAKYSLFRGRRLMACPAIVL
jgi:hypothetical protein